MMENLHIYNAARAVPPEAQKEIKGGRLKGMTDINPMWRLKTLTELFGVCGVGWKYIITQKRIEPTESGETAVFVDIELYIKYNGEWSEAIPGTGGAMFVAQERNGKYVSDECFKMALTDAISVACKALGFGADIYWQKDRSKYDQQTKAEPIPCEGCGKEITAVKKRDKTDWIPSDVAAYSQKRFGKKLCAECQKQAVKSEDGT